MGERVRDTSTGCPDLLSACAGKACTKALLRDCSRGLPTLKLLRDALEEGGGLCCPPQVPPHPCSSSSHALCAPRLGG